MPTTIVSRGFEASQSRRTHNLPSIQRISVPALEELLNKPHVRNNSPEAGRIVSCFAILSATIAYEDYQSHELALAAVTEQWEALVHETDLNNDNRTYMKNHNLSVTVCRLYKGVHIERRRGLRGEALSLRAAALVTLTGLKFLEIKDDQDPRFRNLTPGRDQLFPIAAPAPRQRKQRLDIETISESIHGRPGNRECGICFEKPTRIKILKSCGHYFCVICLDEWVNGGGEGATESCPVCKTKLRG
ncbi:hypothetical protein CC80DRAFT_229020 [Byssothecium circinans]|uniref:RING-type domain-containing protein n=1 Tax=Byssothecium circinans TaxID=147558 RepID=A0A6A5TE37_9PLEO|nr:hypothetical protein CC80DRAFT_229020 [Byssothecium circinans]